MTDDRLRALERRFRETGSVEDEAAWLRARVQAGELSGDYLRLAAYMSQEAAVLALGPGSPEIPREGVVDPSYACVLAAARLPWTRPTLVS